GGEERNRAWLGGHVSFAPSVDETVAALMFDPQTSGGLLLAASARKAKALEAAFERDGLEIWPIGRAVPGEGIAVGT
ncbi:MAG: selenide, water dikinase SelD, partial [Dehalococcoidia bacterium]|nr:selenide, water dikinase SelD [Dehalococcoidia bacterium]